MKTIHRVSVCAAVALSFAVGSLLVSTPARAAEYFVSKQGSDAAAGTSRELAFLTVQKGVAALQPGDVLTIAPGEYTEAVERKDLGSAEKPTVIRAEIPGTVLLRGDIPAPKFTLMPGRQFTYVADFDFQGQVPVMNEIDTLTNLGRMPNDSEPEFVPGTFFHDAAAKKLYVSASDMKPATSHRYSVAVIPKNGIYLVRPRRVTIEGITVTGFSSMEVMHYTMGTAGGVWGIFLLSAHGCEVRECRAYLNGWGIGLNSQEPGSGENVVERCTAWGNNSAFAFGDMGGISIFGARRDVVRNCTAYLNGMYGINIYGTGGAPPNGNDGGNVPEKKSVLVNNLAWGNKVADFKVKTGYDYYHTLEHSTTTGKSHCANVVASLLGSDNHDLTGKHAERDIRLNLETELDPNVEFADPKNYDFRLQATSRFRKTGPKGTDRGPAQYAASIFYVKPDGDDAADGLSLKTAWKTLARGVKDLKPGDTLYLEPGRYKGPVALAVQGTPEAPIVICGRGTGDVVIDAGANEGHSTGSDIRFERLRFFRVAVPVEGKSRVKFKNCFFDHATLLAIDAADLAVEHCTFVGLASALTIIKCSDVRLTGNLFGSKNDSTVSVDRPESITYSNYNSYRNALGAWKVRGKFVSLVDLRKAHDQESQEITPQFAVVDGIQTLKNPEAFAGAGPFGKSIGISRNEAYGRELKLVNKPKLHSVSATTANLEWTVTIPATCEFAWGETPACEQTGKFDVKNFATYSLTDLKPGTKYYFRLKQLSIPTEMVAHYDHQPVAPEDNLLEFTTAAKDAAPTTYYVSVGDGDDSRTGLSREQAWKTIRHAAAKVNVGDTVLIAGGKYAERVRIRATGTKAAPITFRCVSGERVELDGALQALNNAFVVGRKNNLRFDGFYLAGFNMFPDSRWPLGKGAEFHLYECKDIDISRCFSDGRGGYSAESVDAYYTENLTISNCVNTNKMGGALYIWRCPNFVARNNVFAAPMILSFVLRNTKTQTSTMDNNIFTDMFDKKARLNIGLLCVDGELAGFRQHNNCYLLRDVIPLKERALLTTLTIGEAGAYIHEPLFADPAFAGDPNPAAGNPVMPNGVRVIAPDRMMDAKVPLDFNSFFATNPDVVKRGMGLQPEAFKDFRFSTPVKTPAAK